MKKKKNTVITIIVMLILAAIIVGGYFLISARKNAENYEGSKEKNEVDNLLEKNLDSSYPVTAREVVKFYSRILKCYYNETLSEQQLGGLLDQMRKLFDEELLAENPRDTHLADLQEEIRDFAARKCTITSYQVEQAGNIITWTDEEKNYARVIASYTQFEKEENHYLKVYEEFILRKDDSGKWKILGWQLADAEDMK